VHNLDSSQRLVSIHFFAHTYAWPFSASLKARPNVTQEAAEPYANVELKTAYIPDPFGTHHSKMLILFRHDDLAQVVIHTANMIERDWRNMTQAVWRSPLLPLKRQTGTSLSSRTETQSHPIGCGERFKTDLLRYLDMYEKRLKGLTQQLLNYDFSSIRAAFIGSAPSRQKPVASKPSTETSFGWLGLGEILSTVPVHHAKPAVSPPGIIVQISSIATLGQNPNWLSHFQSILSRYTLVTSLPSSDTAAFFKKASSKSKTTPKELEPTLNIIFPTPHEIRTSLDGYGSGGSIHTKIQSAAQQKQLEYLRPLLCHWKYSTPDAVTQQESKPPRREAYRGPAAPHIKTYIRFSDANRSSIDWAMVTSANLSKQAWGEMENKKGEVWIQSWETGVVVWPALYGDPDKTTMVPVFGKDVPTFHDVVKIDGEEGAREDRNKVIGLRMPYDLPLTPYLEDEVPWCATLPQNEPDWMGRTWPGY
jgi:tyrosyl-DNA phosphodiesterase-1